MTISRDSTYLLRDIDTPPRPREAAPETPTDLAYRALLDHIAECERCEADWRKCPTRRALTETLRGVRG
ncbi:hypothetical protein [Streptomyces sp. KL116D]|uniref:hypothetical protein n=1 Tax=Streptomyces sp. KL116D TaxID=3045152 RepID=UPI003557B2E5